MKSNHTPGPWMTEEEYRNGSPYLIYAPGSIKIADLRNSTNAEAPENDAEFDANARLIAAAPDMLAALIEAASLIPVAPQLHPRDLFNLQKTVTSVIARATEAP